MTEVYLRSALLAGQQQPHNSGLLDLCAACPGRVLPHSIMVRFLTVLAEEAISPLNIDSAAPQRMRVGPRLRTGHGRLPNATWGKSLCMLMSVFIPLIVSAY
jgi:hypothetical protein